MEEYLLSLLIFSPLGVALLLLFIPEKFSSGFKFINLLLCIFQLILAGILYAQFDPAGVGYAFQEKKDWIDMELGSLGHLSIDYFLGVDGLSISLVILNALVMCIAAVSSWKINTKRKGYFALLLLLNASIMGCFMALDLFLFFLFFEFMLLPMYFLIGLWGGPRREYAAIKFFIYTLFGSVFILVVMIGLYLSVIDPEATIREAGIIGATGNIQPEHVSQIQDMMESGELKAAHLVHTFSIPAMMDAGNYIPDSILNRMSDIRIGDYPVRLIAFLLLMIGFAIKLPMVPFHTWLPDAHVEAPTPISVILAGVLLKIGAYGMLRIAYGIFPEGGHYFAWWIGLFGVISIIYAAYNALAMDDLKKLIAYSSVSHMGFVLLGIASVTSEGISGALFQLFSHGIISSLLFLVAGVIYDRTGDRMIENYRGLATIMPAFTAVVVIGFFASLGLPGFSGFIAEVLILLGAFNSATTNSFLPAWMAIVATLGLLLGAAYYLWALQRMFFGSFWTYRNSWKDKLQDLSVREYIMFVPLVLLMLLLGIMPHFFLDLVGPAVGSFVHWVNTTGAYNLEKLVAI